MKRIIKYFIILLIIASCSQKNEKNTKTELKEHYLKAYQQAKNLNDYVAEANTLFHLTILDNENKNKWEDSLFVAYIKIGNNLALTTLGEKILQRKPNDTLIIGILSETFLTLGNLEKAYQYQLKMYEITKDVKEEYRLATLEFNMNNIDSAKTRILKLLKNPEIKNKTVTITMRDGLQQEVPLEAALHNALGIIYVAEQKIKKAEQEFKKAIKIKPNFILARNNLQTFIYRR